MGKKRIYEVAKEYGKSTNEVLDLLKRHNIEKSNFSAVDDSDLVIIDKEYNKKPPVPAKKEVVKKEQPVNMQKQQVKKPEQNGMNKNVPQHNQTIAMFQKFQQANLTALGYLVTIIMHKHMHNLEQKETIQHQDLAI